MQHYPVRPSHRRTLTTAHLEEVCRETFEEVAVADERIVGKFGAIARLQTWPDGKELAVDLVMDSSVPEPVQQETIRRFNRFLEAATGFSAKERARRLRKSAAPPSGSS
ncbi:MAG: DUF5611 family protein [Thermoplasmata archaeon]